METLKNNILIAEFIGYDVNHKIGGVDFGFKSDYSEIFRPHYPSKKIVSSLCVDELQFHKSWDWLMPVVEKIESIEDDSLPYISFSKNNFSVTIRNSSCQIISGDYGDTDWFDRFSEGSKIKSVYKAVVEFIKWYNKNK